MCLPQHPAERWVFKAGLLKVSSSLVPKSRGIQNSAGKQSKSSWAPQTSAADAYVDEDFSLPQLPFPYKADILHCFNPGEIHSVFRDI